VLREQLGIADGPVVGFIGSFYAYEGLDLLLDALPGMLKAQPRLRVLLVGGGPQDEALKKQALSLDIADRVVFAGRVPNGEVPRYYDLIDVLAYPRRSMRLTELVTPLKPLECMAGGRLFVASDVGGHRELIRHGETGVLFEAGSVPALQKALLQLLDAKDAWPALRSAARAFVEGERTWRNSVLRYQKVYEGLALKAAA
jgi:glycosyltransferase involved in cell wall biosynthesis